MTEVKLKKGEPVERAIRQLKKKFNREQTLHQFRLCRLVRNRRVGGG